MKRIKIEIPKEFKTMAGIEYGEKIFNQQISSNVENEKEIKIEIPGHINNITNTFLEGLLIGRQYSGVNPKISFTSGDKSLEERINFQLSLLDDWEEIIEEDKMKIKEEIMIIREYINNLKEDKGKYSIADIANINTIDNKGEVIVLDFEKQGNNYQYQCISLEGNGLEIINCSEDELESSNSNIKYSRNGMERFKNIIYDIHPKLNSQDFVEFMINKEKENMTSEKPLLISDDGLTLVRKSELAAVYGEKRYVTGRMQPNYHVFAKVNNNDMLISIEASIEEARDLIEEIGEWINTDRSGNFQV